MTLTVSTIDYPIKKIRTLLDNNWDTSETVIGDVPVIHTGNEDDPANDPQVALINERETPKGTNGYHGMGKHGPTRLLDGTVDCDISTTGKGYTEDPEDIVESLENQVIEIITLNATSTDFQMVSPGQSNKNPSGIKEPTKERKVLEINYQYFEEIKDI